MDNTDLKPVEYTDGAEIPLPQIFDATIRRGLAAAQHFAKLAAALTGAGIREGGNQNDKPADEIKKALDACACFERLASGIKALYQGLYGEAAGGAGDPAGAGQKIEFVASTNG